MTKPNATTMPLTVKVVRECATKTINHQRDLLDERLRDIARAYNDEVAKYNVSRWTKLFRRAPKQPVVVDEVIVTWKKLWLSGNMRGDHLAYQELWITRVGWWKRLRQLEALPVADDDKVMNVSVEDLDLIDYNIWTKEQA